MSDFEIPLFKKVYDFFKIFYELRKTIPKQDRFTIGDRCSCLVLEVLEEILQAGNVQKQLKLPFLEKASLKLNILRVLIRLMKDVRSIDVKKYIILESMVDEIGKMLGGWIRFVKNS